MFVYFGEMVVFILGRWCYVLICGDVIFLDFNELFIDYKIMVLWV